jgi:hypothetical protein
VKKTTAILFLILACLYTGGLFLAFQAKKASIKNEVRAYLNQNPNAAGEFLEFGFKNNAVTNNGFEWEDSHEFSYKGEMYDVISLDYKKDKLIIHCIKDTEENVLIQLYSKMQGKTHKASHNEFKFYSLLFSLPSEKNETVISSTGVDFTNTYFFDLPAGYSAIGKQPPRA